MTQAVEDSFEWTPHLASRAEWQAAWKPTLAAALGWAAGGVLLINVSSVFLRPLIEETGWSTSQTLLAPIVSGLYAIMSPLAGRAVDRYGPKRVAATGQTLLILSILIFVATPLSRVSFYSFGVAAGLSGAFSFMVPFNCVIASWYDRSAGKAYASLGIVAALLALSSTPLIAAAIYSLGGGWRLGYLVLAGIMFVFGLVPVLWGLANKPTDATSDQTGSSASAARASRAVPAMGGSKPVGTDEITTFTGTLRSGSIWGLGICMFLVAIAISGFHANLQPIMLNSGLSVEAATTISSLFFLAVMVGRLVGGIMLDTMSRYYAAFIVFAIAAMGALVLANTSHIGFATALFGTSLIAIGQGAEADFLGYFVQREFGSKSFAITFGTILPMFMAGTVVGPYLVAFLRDVTGDYRIALNIGSAFYVLGIVALLVRMIARNRRGTLA